MWPKVESVFWSFAGALLLWTLAYLRWWLRKRAAELAVRKLPPEVREEQEASLNVSLALNEILLEFPSVMRVYLFHVGHEKYRTHEIPRPGVSRQAEFFFGKPIAKEEMALIKEEGISFTLIRDLPRSEFRWIMEQGGAKATIRVGIYRRSGGEPVAAIGADFDSEQKPEGIDCAIDIAYRVGQYLRVG